MELNNNLSENVQTTSGQTTSTQTPSAQTPSTQTTSTQTPSTQTPSTQTTKPLYNNKNVTTHILLEQFKEMLTKDKVVFYDKKGRKSEFDNMGIFSRRTVKLEDKNGPRNKFIVVMKTYLHLSGDMVTMEWDNTEVKYTTKLNHPDLENWSSKMYWKGTYSESQAELKGKNKVESVSEVKQEDEVKQEAVNVQAVSA